MAFIVQAEQNNVTDSGIFISAEKKGMISHGKIHAINSNVICPHCTQQFDRKDLKVGDQVVFSRYVAEQIPFTSGELKDKKVFAVYIDAILAKYD